MVYNRVTFLIKLKDRLENSFLHIKERIKLINDIVKSFELVGKISFISIILSTLENI